MLTKNNILDILKTYNINSQAYEPTIYENANEIGICLDFKDSTFGYLTRLFTFTEKKDLNNFLTSYFWYKKNKKKYHIKLCLDKYNNKKPNIIYKYQDKTLSLDDMLNIDKLINNESKEKKEEQEKIFYLESIKELTNYLINFKQLKENIKVEKNKLKAEENDLKYTLLEELVTYYGKEKILNKKPIVLEPTSSIDNTILLENLSNINNKSIEEIKNYLNTLINIIKNEELDEKNLINIYSNTVYKYNIDILKKQIDFVRNKINAEKNFNLKGSKIHNIDEELKSFLKTNIAPTKIEVFINDNKNNIIEKFKNTNNLKEACQLITGKTILMPQIKENFENIDIHTYLLEQFNNLPKTTQNNLILFQSIYKPICNFIIDNNYPDINKIIENFDFKHYYEDLEEIVFNENNNHYLTNYFFNIDFKNLNNYIASIINICKDFENTLFSLPKQITLFSINTNNKYKHLASVPTPNSKFIINTNNKLIFIPQKIEIDWDNVELTLIEEDNYYTKDNIIEELETINLNKYNKKNIAKDGIIITTDLILNEEIIFNKGHLEGENYE